MPILHARPPTRVHSSTPITESTAHEQLSSYLAASKSKPHLHPDADLHPDGPHFSTHGPRGGIILHLLRRLERGLAGEMLTPDTPEELQAFAQPARGPAQAVPETPPKKPGRGRAVDGAPLDWEDPDVYAREQDRGMEDVGEIGPRSNVVGPVDGVPVVRVEGGAVGKSREEKERRKAEKKARSKREKKERKKAKG